MAAPSNEIFCGENCEKILHIEASAAIKEIEFAVSEVELSEKLPKSDETVYLNLTTKEKEKFCVELSVQGFRIVSHKYDTIEDNLQTGYYETIYSLLDQVSPDYRNTFGDALMAKLSYLQQAASETDENDQNPTENVAQS